MIYFPFIGALALASGTIFEKIVLRNKKVDTRLYQTVSFLSIALVMLPFIYLFWNLDPQALTQKNAFIFILVVFISMLANLFMFYSMKWEKISNLEPARILEPLFVILLAVLFSFFIDSNLFERNLKVIIPALIAGLALIFSHVKKHHVKINKYFLSAILGSFFFALELVISRIILDYYSPITFYFLRCSSIFLLSLLAFDPDFKKIDKSSFKIILLTALIWFVYRIIVYYGYLSYGVIFTTLMIMLGPILIYIFARIFLKEKLSWRNIVASIIILLCVLYAVLM